MYFRLVGGVLAEQLPCPGGYLMACGVVDVWIGRWVAGKVRIGVLGRNDESVGGRVGGGSSLMV